MARERLEVADPSKLNLKWDKRGIITARQVAAMAKSEDKRGAVIWSADHKPISSAYNGFPSEISDIKARLDKDKLRRLLELSAVDWALWLAVGHHALPGATVYMWPTAPTVHEALLIMRAHCARVVVQVNSQFEEWPNLTAKGLLEEAGVHCLEAGVI